MYRIISVSNMNKLHEILLDTKFTGKKIQVKIPELKFNINIDEITFYEKLNEYQFVSSFLWNETFDVVEYKNRKFEMGFETFRRRLPEAKYSINVSLNCDCNDFDLGFGQAFYQLELSEALEDDENIYIVRNISKMLQNNSKAMMQKFESEIVLYNDEYFLLISKVNKNYLENKVKHLEIIYDFFENFIKCAFVNEGLKLGLYD